MQNFPLFKGTVTSVEALVHFVNLVSVEHGMNPVLVGVLEPEPFHRFGDVVEFMDGYAHLLDYILADPQRLAAFNTAITKKYPKKTSIVVAKYEDFTEELSERETVEIANVANTFSSVVFRILKKELDRRNIAAHPSNVIIGQHQADDMISELVNNVLLALT